MRSFPALRTLALVLALPLGAMDTYKIDSSHSEVAFRVRDRLFKTSGRFNRIAGTLRVDPKDISRSSVEVSIEAASINTGEGERDEDLRSARFFDAAKFPAITFKSTAVKDLGQGRLQVTGDFTLHGVTKRISFPILNAGNEVIPDGSTTHVTICFIDGALKLNRSEFGIKAFPVVIGEEVEISLSVVAEQPKSS